MSSRARWTHNIPDYSNNLAEAAKMSTLGDTSAETGLSQKTLRDLLTRDPITSERNPLRVLCRPAGRIKSDPLWSRAQIKDYLHRAERTVEDSEDRDERPPAYLAEEAERLGLVTTSGFAEMIGKHDQTLRRFARTDNTYPPVVGVLSRPNQPGVPEHLRSLVACVKWAKGRKYPIPVRVQAQAEELHRQQRMDLRRKQEAEFARKALLAAQGV